MSLELAAMRWLWIDQKCLVVLEERTPKYGMGQPDVLGVTPGRYLTEIEIKRSMADFRADFLKTHRMVRNDMQAKVGEEWEGMHALCNHPRQFYYLVPENLVEKVTPLLPGWAGLMTCHHLSIVTVKVRAPVNKASTKLGPKACARLSRMMTAHMMSYALSNHTIKENYKNGVNFDFTDWVDCNSGTYQV